MTYIPDEDDPLYSVATVAKMFDLTTYTVRQWINTKRVKAVKIMGQWRIPKSELVRIANEEHN